MNDDERTEQIEHWINELGLEGETAERFRDGGRYWILIGGETVAVSMSEWARWFHNADQRIIGQEDVIGPDGETYWVSTVFLGLNHSFGGGTRPLLFETMVFLRHEERVIGTIDGEDYTSDRAEVYMRRFSTLREAEAGHELALLRVREGKLNE